MIEMAYECGEGVDDEKLFHAEADEGEREVF